ncbi:tRNA 5-methylaminomethyl-2-thiouridine biosynthesis bifunctional protein MnmC [Comamonas phosphati]|nr:tRNA 5-methylaminomethyl-2-thiouridine biosynthesis bifunctional protein MnmC [Comamonas phosphati]
MPALPPPLPLPAPDCLGGCGLPTAWAGAPQWRILATRFGPGLDFLAAWAAWKADPMRPRLLHFVAIEASPASAEDLLRALPADSPLRPLGEALAAQWWGLLPGVHRLSFENGQVLLTLYVGDAQTMLRKQQLTADSVYLDGLDGFSPGAAPELWSPEALKNLARHCRRGTLLAAANIGDEVRQSLARLGFEIHTPAGQPSLSACFNPRWEPRHRDDGLPSPIAAPARCLVLGAGLAGAAAAASLARRGWQVTVLDAGEAPASGASGLPAGLFCPHVSPDDSVLSRLSRSGVRTSLQTLQQLSAGHALESGVDWAHSGVLEHDLNQPAELPPAWLSPESGLQLNGRQWSHPAQPDQLAAARLTDDSQAVWHVQAGWVRPARLVRALLAAPGIRWQGHAQVARLQPTAASTWQALDAQDQVLAQAEMVVLALGPATTGLLQASGLEAGQWEIQPIRGQVSVAEHTPATRAAMPPFPVNGNGNLVPDFPGPDSAGQEHGHQWVMGSTFERDVTDLPPSPQDQRGAHAGNADKLAALLPACRPALDSFFDAPQLPPTWSRVRCAAYDRIPVVGPVGRTAGDLPGLWTLTGLGSRGLTLSLLCGELLAARLHGEPLPLDAKLAQALGTQRMWGRLRHKAS